MVLHALQLGGVAWKDRCNPVHLEAAASAASDPHELIRRMMTTARMTDTRTFSIPRIEPVPEGIARPLWSVMIPTYNSERWLRQTLQSVIAQDCGPERMQIE